MKQFFEIPFSKTECGVDFYINTAENTERRGLRTEYPSYKTDFFEVIFFHKANGYVLLSYRKIELKDNMVLFLLPHQQQEWHVDESSLKYDFLIFREDFMHTYIADKFFVYRLQYFQQTGVSPYFIATETCMAEYMRILRLIRPELRHPVADSYHIIISVLYYLLSVLNRQYTAIYHLPPDAPKNNYAFLFVELMEKHIRKLQRVQEYAGLLHINRVTLNQSVMSQYGLSATQLLRLHLLAEIKNELLFSQRSVSQIAYDFNFSDPSHLMRFFKKATGKTCTQYQTDYSNGIYEC